MKTALIFGSSGLVGGQLLVKLIQNNNYNKIKVFVRSDPQIKDVKLEIIKNKKVQDGNIYDSLEVMIMIDKIYKNDKKITNVRNK